MKLVSCRIKYCFNFAAQHGDQLCWAHLKRRQRGQPLEPLVETQPEKKLTLKLGGIPGANGLAGPRYINQEFNDLLERFFVTLPRARTTGKHRKKRAALHSHRGDT